MFGEVLVEISAAFCAPCPASVVLRGSSLDC
jgi:hypothetical protein